MSPLVDTGRFVFEALPLAGLKRVQRKAIEDSRGFFLRFFCRDEFAAVGMTQPIVQMNHTLTRKRGALRGMHYQEEPHAETKLVTCLAGEVFDVAIDLRQGSPTYLCWHGEILSASNRRSLLIPEGFAHGFQALTDDCELFYLHTAAYEKSAEAGMRFDDPAVAISWPLPVGDLSDRDRSHPLINFKKSGN